MTRANWIIVRVVNVRGGISSVITPSIYCKEKKFILNLIFCYEISPWLRFCSLIILRFSNWLVLYFYLYANLWKGSCTIIWTSYWLTNVAFQLSNITNYQSKPYSMRPRSDTHIVGNLLRFSSNLSHVSILPAINKRDGFKGTIMTLYATA